MNFLHIKFSAPKVIIAVLVIILLGYILPFIFISNGLKEVNADDKILVTYILGDVEQAMDNPLDNILVTKLKIVSINSNKGMIAQLRVYTLFGIPYANVSVINNQIIINRLFVFIFVKSHE